MASTTAIERVTTPAGDPAWQVSDYQQVKTLLGDPRLGRSHADPARAARYSESVIFGQASGSPETEEMEHGWMRRLLTPAFSARRMERLRPRVQELTERLLEAMSQQSAPVDFHEAVSCPLPVLVICELLGVPYEDQDRFRHWSDEAGHTMDGERSRVGLEALRGYMTELLERKRRQPGEDVISDLAQAQEQLQGAFRDDHVAQLAAGLLFAGHETTVAAIDRGVLLLLTHPAQREAMLRDDSLVARTVEEVLRHPDPAQLQDEHRRIAVIPRWAKEDIELDGVTIPRGDLVLLALENANRQEDVFACPAQFDVMRAENPHLTFGHGPHFCLGAPLARIELQTVFGTIFKRFPSLRLAVPIEQLRRRSEALTGGVENLPVVW